MSSDELLNKLDALNETMATEEAELKEQIANLSKVIDDLMAGFMPAPENRPAEPTITIVNTVTGEEKVITQSEYEAMIQNSQF